MQRIEGGPDPERGWLSGALAPATRSRFRAAVPWLFLLLALWIALIGLDATAPVACDETPKAFTHGVTTVQSTTLEAVASRCEVTDRSTHVTVAKTVVNWSGLIASIVGSSRRGYSGRQSQALWIAAARWCGPPGSPWWPWLPSWFSSSKAFARELSEWT